MELISDSFKEEEDWIWEHEMPNLTRIREQTMSLYDDTNIKPTDCSCTRVMLDNLLAEMDALEEALDKTVNANSELQKEEKLRYKEYQLSLLSSVDIGYEWEYEDSEYCEKDHKEEQSCCTGLKPAIEQFIQQQTHSGKYRYEKVCLINRKFHDTPRVERVEKSKRKIPVKDHLSYIPTIWKPGRPPDPECGLIIDGCTGGIFLHVEMTISLDVRIIGNAQRCHQSLMIR